MNLKTIKRAAIGLVLLGAATIAVTNASPAAHAAPAPTMLTQPTATGGTQRNSAVGQQVSTYDTTIRQLQAAAAACSAASQTWDRRDSVPITLATIRRMQQDLRAYAAACAAEGRAFAAHSAPKSFPNETRADARWIQKVIAAAVADAKWAKQESTYMHDTAIRQLGDAVTACNAASQTWNRRDVGPIAKLDRNQMQQDLQTYATACTAQGQAFAAVSAPKSFPNETPTDAGWIQKDIAAAADDVKWAKQESTYVTTIQQLNDAVTACDAASQTWNGRDVGSIAQVDRNQLQQDLQAYATACAAQGQAFAAYSAPNSFPLETPADADWIQRVNAAAADEANWAKQESTHITTIQQLNDAVTACNAAVQTWSGRDVGPIAQLDRNQWQEDLQAYATACTAQGQAFAAYSAPDSFPLETPADANWIQKDIAAAAAQVNWTKQESTYITTILQLNDAWAACDAASQTWNGRDVGPITSANIDGKQQDLQAYATACAAQGQAFAAFTAPDSFPLETPADADWIQKDIAATASDAQWVASQQQLLNTARASFAGASAPQPATGTGGQPTNTAGATVQQSSLSGGGSGSGIPMTAAGVNDYNNITYSIYGNQDNSDYIPYTGDPNYEGS